MVPRNGGRIGAHIYGSVQQLAPFTIYTGMRRENAVNQRTFSGARLRDGATIRA